MRDVAILGRDHIKVDSLDKVLGRAKFAADYYMPDMLYGGVFRSTVPHAYIKKLNLEKARALPGVAAVLDLPPDHARQELYLCPALRVL